MDSKISITGREFIQKELIGMEVISKKKVSKKEEYFKYIQQIAKTNNVENYLLKIDLFLQEQKILKRNLIKTTEDKLKIYYVEYVRSQLKEDYYNSKIDIVDLLYVKISETCLNLKTVSTDSILIFILTNMKDVINNIKINDYKYRKNLIKEYELKIKKLKEDFI